MPAKKERVFWLDFTRAVAILLIVVYHFQWNYYQAHLPFCLVPMRIADTLIGDIGSSVFLMISGAALMMVYENKFEARVFYRKRFLGLYPMFWIAWILAYLVRSFLNGGFEKMASFRSLILTVLGIDLYTYGATGMQTWAIVGEWFLGLILIFYLLFPLLRKAVLNRPVILCIVCLVLFAATFFAQPLFRMDPSLIPTYRLTEFVFGMIFTRYIRKTKFYVPLAAAAYFLVMSLSGIKLPKPIAVAAAGIGAFLILAWLGNAIRLQWVRRLFLTVAKYSYPIFLIHHFIINNVELRLGLQTENIGHVLLLFLICMSLIAASSVAIYWIEKGVMHPFRRKKISKIHEAVS